MGLFDLFRKKSVDKSDVKRITVYTSEFAYSGWVGENTNSDEILPLFVILYHLDLMKDDVFKEKVENYMQNYRILYKPLKKEIPAIKTSIELREFASKSFKSYPEKADCNLITEMFPYLYLIEYGKPDATLELDERTRKRIKYALFAQNPLDAKYEKQAQAIIEILKSKSSDNAKNGVRIIGEQINNFDQMTLISYRVEKLAREQKVSNYDIQKFLGNVWEGIAGWTKK